MFKGKSSRRRSEVRTISYLFHGVEVLPGHNACSEVRELERASLLSEDAPMLPLAACSRFTKCTCRYRHFKDCRLEIRRDTDDGLPQRFMMQERRSQAGCRVTDH
jgi:hypothetical protein